MSVLQPMMRSVLPSMVQRVAARCCTTTTAAAAAGQSHFTLPQVLGTVYLNDAITSKHLPGIKEWIHGSDCLHNAYGHTLNLLQIKMPKDKDDAGETYRDIQLPLDENAVAQVERIRRS
ncbi:hypothetical protein FOZ62_008064 [Perkinsus olseni]|uniref:Uncharacterized protein n=1 Tax=Perkinsus olseni TaxID=32597 RepID=A0A7J6T512_PEROL|nr:hypothetical protein FOZ62_008064 [Perkinsus olseni]